MPPAMGQPINVVEKPSSTPGVARFETNRSLTGMGHERYASVDDILDDRPVDELARRLFDSGGVTQVHANGSMVTVHLTDGWTGEKLLDVIRGLYIYYPPPAGRRPRSVALRRRVAERRIRRAYASLPDAPAGMLAGRSPRRRGRRARIRRVASAPAERACLRGRSPTTSAQRERR